jgi:hypothetical protein
VSHDDNGLFRIHLNQIRIPAMREEGLLAKGARGVKSIVQGIPSPHRPRRRRGVLVVVGSNRHERIEFREHHVHE